MYLREATISDCDLLFNWVNDPEVRKQSITTKTIEKTDHVTWFLNKLQSKKSKIFILISDDLAVGQIRFDQEDGNWVIDYSIAKDYRGKGLGKFIIGEGMKKFPSNSHFIAYVKPNNLASIKVFTSLGFTKVEVEKARDPELVKFTN